MRTRRSALPPAALRRIARAALEEDRWKDDVTTVAVVPASTRATGRVVAQASGVVSGLGVASAVAGVAGLSVQRLASDGDRVRRGTAVLVVRGRARAVLAAERTLLNFLMHLSGVATETTAARRAVGPRGPAVWATRKTIPGLRDLEKAAVEDGGGLPHRRDLSDALLVKGNHVALVPLRVAIDRARANSRGRRVQVEVRTLAEARSAIAAGANDLLIDNATAPQARRIIRQLRRDRPRSQLRVELSGGITPGNVRLYRRTGADAVSLGALTHSARALPFHMTVRPLRR
ncbi:MAG: carboxylating nicotinate-nucleotide diphosphorylase [Thermoplasmata archaeon]|nr:carboxylating nicotinate-nucleotide diphosphorylase [Thermoplasmata archaeon]